MKKTLKWIFIALGALLLGFIIFISIKRSLREEAVLVFPDTVVVENSTNFYTEKLVKAIVYNVLGYDTMHVVTSYMPENLQTIGDLTFNAFIVKNPFEPRSYNIFLSRKLSSSKLKITFAHELYHLKQMEDGDLIQLMPNLPMSIWKGDTIKYKEVNYKFRPEEISAFLSVYPIMKELDKIWYK